MFQNKQNEIQNCWLSFELKFFRKQFAKFYSLSGNAMCKDVSPPINKSFLGKMTRYRFLLRNTRKEFITVWKKTKINLLNELSVLFKDGLPQFLSSRISWLRKWLMKKRMQFGNFITNSNKKREKRIEYCFAKRLFIGRKRKKIVRFAKKICRKSVIDIYCAIELTTTPNTVDIH